MVQYCFCFIFFIFCPQVTWILVPQPGIEPSSPALESKVSTLGPREKSLSPVLNSLKARAKCCMLLYTWAFHAVPLNFCLFFPDLIISKGASQVAQWVKNLPASAGDTGDTVSTPRLGEGNGNLLQNSCLENSINRGAWPATVHSVTKNQT